MGGVCGAEEEEGKHLKLERGKRGRVSRNGNCCQFCDRSTKGVNMECLASFKDGCFLESTFLFPPHSPIVRNNQLFRPEMKKWCGVAM